MLKLAAERQAAFEGGHIGLASSTERVESLGGRLELDSAPDHGTRARAVLPA